MLAIEVPEHPSPELDYVLHVVFDVFLGLDYACNPGTTEQVVVTDGDRRLCLPASFFDRSAGFDSRAIRLPLRDWDSEQFPLPIRLTTRKVPVLLGEPGIVVGDNVIQSSMDLLGSIFFMLSRIEETSDHARDQHDRYSSESSLAVRAGFLSRPIVDEYVEIIWACLLRLWPRLQRKSRQFRLYATCDVDRPYAASRTHFGALLRHCVRDGVLNRDPALAWRDVRNFVHGLRGTDDLSCDGYSSGIDWLATEAEAAGRDPMTFFFKAGCSNPSYDENYSLDEPSIAKMLVNLHRRGHEIGIHPSYETYRNPALVCQEADRLRRALTANGIAQEQLRGRQHYLRWAMPATARAYEEAGIACDSTLSYADRAGFRCGTCHTFPLFDACARERLRLVEVPLVVMECSVITYMKLGYTRAALDTMLSLKETCRLFDGTFTFLWHNSHLLTKNDRAFCRALFQ